MSYIVHTFGEHKYIINRVEKLWYFKDVFHRVNGPAIEYHSGSKYWWLNGQRHREDGPAVEYSNGSKGYYLNGRNYSEAEFNAEIIRRKNNDNIIQRTSA